MIFGTVSACQDGYEYRNRSERDRAELTFVTISARFVCPQNVDLQSLRIRDYMLTGHMREVDKDHA